MILHRLGNKKQIAKKIYSLFPKHDIYIELFMGAGGMYFSKPKARHNFINDKDDDVYNFFRQLIDNKEALLDMIIKTPVTETQFKEWGKGKQEEEPLMKAIRFLFISNYGLYGKPNTLRIGPVNVKKVIIENIDQVLHYISDAYFFNDDFRDAFRKCDYKTNKNKTFCYCDPPYLETDNNYSEGFNEQDSSDLFDILQESGIRWAMSEFDHPFILEQAKGRDLFVNEIGERRNLHNKRTEILVTNYVIPQLKLDLI